MPVHPPISDEKQAHIVELARAGVPRNKIARDVGVSVATVTKYASAAGVSFDRRRTAAASAAAKVDSAQRREEEAVAMLTDIAAQRAELRKLVPKDFREHESRSRSLANLAQAWTKMNDASPIPDTSTEDRRQEMRDFMGALGQLRELGAQLSAYEQHFGPLPAGAAATALGNYDNYGRPPEDEEPALPDVSLHSL